MVRQRLGPDENMHSASNTSTGPYYFAQGAACKPGAAYNYKAVGELTYHDQQTSAWKNFQCN